MYLNIINVLSYVHMRSGIYIYIYVHVFKLLSRYTYLNTYIHIPNTDQKRIDYGFNSKSIN